METNHAVILFREYMGTGLIVIWYLLSLVYLFLKEERKSVRILFVYVPILLLLLFFNPLFTALMTRYVGDDIYYRMLWLLPMTAVIAYSCVCICGKLIGKKRIVFAVSIMLLAMVSGSCIYVNPVFTKAENLYHMPDSVVHICDAIEVPGREVMAVFPLELVQYVRQYSPIVCMPYGREILVEAWNEWAVQNELCDAMEAEIVEAGTLGALARQEACVYIVLPGDKTVRGNLLDAGYEKFLETDGYVIYRDQYFDPGM